MVGLGGLEPPTSSLSGMRSSHLSYRPKGFQNWWSWSGSNRRPPECKSGALPAELQPLSSAAWPPLRNYRGRLDAADGTRRAGQANHRTLSGDPRTDLDWKGCCLLTACLRARLGFKADSATPATFSLRKEVIQPQVLLRLPCYDFTPIMNHTLGPFILGLLVQSTFVM